MYKTTRQTNSCLQNSCLQNSWLQLEPQGSRPLSAGPWILQQDAKNLPRVMLAVVLCSLQGGDDTETLSLLNLPGVR